MASFFDELVDLLLAGDPTAAVERLLAGADISVADAKRWVHDFGEKVVAPIARGDRPKSQPVVIGIPGVMGGQACISGTRIPATIVVAYLRDGAVEEEIRADYPTLPGGAVEAVERWAEQVTGSRWRRLPFDPANYKLQRDPGESDADYTARCRLFGLPSA